MTTEVRHIDAGPPWSGVGDARTLLDLVVPTCRRDPAPTHSSYFSISFVPPPPIF